MPDVDAQPLLWAVPTWGLLLSTAHNHVGESQGSQGAGFPHAQELSAAPKCPHAYIHMCTLTSNAYPHTDTCTYTLTQHVHSHDNHNPWVCAHGYMCVHLHMLTHLYTCTPTCSMQQDVLSLQRRQPRCHPGPPVALHGPPHPTLTLSKQRKRNIFSKPCAIQLKKEKNQCLAESATTPGQGGQRSPWVMSP